MILKPLDFTILAWFSTLKKNLNKKWLTLLAKPQPQQYTINHLRPWKKCLWLVSMPAKALAWERTLKNVFQVILAAKVVTMCQLLFKWISTLIRILILSSSDRRCWTQAWIHIRITRSNRNTGSLPSSPRLMRSQPLGWDMGGGPRKLLCVKCPEALEQRALGKRRKSAFGSMQHES